MGITEKAELEQFERINRTLFKNHPDAIYLLGLDGEFIIANEVVSESTGVPVELLKGNSYQALIHPDYLGDTVSRFLACVGGAPQRYESCVLARDGLKHVDVTNFPYHVDGGVIAVFGIARDITALKSRELSYRRSAEVLKSRNDDLEKMREIIAHDLRRPLSNALGFTRLLESSMLTPEREAEITLFLSKTLRSADAIVRDLNELVSLQSEGRKAVETIGIAYAVNEILGLYEHDVLEVNAEIALSIEPELAIDSVRAYLLSILRNLIGNALKYHSKTSRPVIRIAAQKSSFHVKISVSDNGIGMDLECVGQDLFKMHKRFAPSVAEGNGLGLYLVKEQVQGLGGTVEVESELGVGSTFTVRLPSNFKNALSFQC